MKKGDRINKAAPFHSRDNFCNFCSNSEYVPFLLVNIADSYELNLSSEELSMTRKCCMDPLGVEVGIKEKS
jgi:hypothetical protein